MRFRQFYYQVCDRVKRKVNFAPKISKAPESEILHWETYIHGHISYNGDRTFTFLNRTKSFVTIDWNFSEYGKLWTYNLAYFEYLQQTNLNQENGLHLIYDFLEHEALLKYGSEPYPISLRAMNWIKFLSEHHLEDPKVNVSLYNQYHRLASNLEYHLLANHLLENGFSLLFGAYYFKKEVFYKKAKQILEKELPEQFLNDGAHYELSPMYHQLLLKRLLDCYQLVSKNEWKPNELEDLLKETAEKALGWIQEITFTNGQIPLLNDAAPHIAPTTQELMSYAGKLGLKPTKAVLSDSGYRKFSTENFEMIIDVGQISPAYQPGHSHADSLHFVLNYMGRPIIVDSGISTYEKNERRQWERSTIAHNTVTINNLNSSKVWSGFRVAQRAIVVVHKEEPDCLEASHNGYRELGVTHFRKFEKKNGQFVVTDTLEDTQNKGTQHVGHLHFHPSVQVALKGNTLCLNNEIEMKFSGIKSLQILDYGYAEGFNVLKPSKKVSYILEKSAKFIISSVK